MEPKFGWDLLVKKQPSLAYLPSNALVIAKLFLKDGKHGGYVLSALSSELETWQSSLGHCVVWLTIVYHHSYSVGIQETKLTPRKVKSQG